MLEASKHKTSRAAMPAFKGLTMTRKATYVAVCGSTNGRLFNVVKRGKVAFSGNLRSAIEYCDKMGYRIGCDGSPCVIVD